MRAAAPTGVSRFRAVVLASSFGGLEATGRILGALPASFPLPVAVVQHRPGGSDATFETVVARRSAIAVRPWGARERLDTPGVRLVPSRGVITSADDGSFVHHEVVERISADHFLAVAAPVFGMGLIAVVLTGRMDDGAVGVRVVKRCGGRVLVQDPQTAAAAGMPNAALTTGCVDFVLPLSHIAPAIVALTLAPGADDLLRVSLPSWALSA